MKRSFISRLSVLIVMISMMVSCTKESSEYTSVIPADASAMVGINLQSLIDKSGVSNEDKQKLIDLMKNELSAATFQHAEKIIKDGAESGISIKDPIYLFKSSQLPLGAVAMKVSNIDKLNKTFEMMISEHVAEPVTRINGVDLVKLSGKGVCAFNESTLLITQSSEGEKIITGLMKQDSEESIANNHYYQSMIKKKGDINFFFIMDELARSYKRQLPIDPSKINEIDPKDLAIAGAFSFEKGKVVLQTETLTENEQVKEALKNQQNFIGKLSETFISNFPASTLMYLSFNINGEKLYNTLQENEQFRKSLSLDKAEKVKDIFGAFNGDVSVGLINVTMSDVPTFVAYAEAKSGLALQTLYESKSEMGLGRGEDIVKLGENQYVFKSRNMNIFLGYKDKYIYATNDELINKNIGKKESNSLKDTEFSSTMKGKNQYMVVNMKAILDLPAVKMVTAFGGKEAAMYVDMASKVSNLDVVGSDNYQSEITLWLTDKNTNSLKQMVDLAKQYAGM